MRIGVIGTGGIGGVTAACLLRQGVDVTPVARDPEARAVMARKGLCVTNLDGTTWQVPLTAPPVAALSDAKGPFDAVIVAVQAPALEAALQSARGALSPETLIVVFQNGLPEARAAALVPDARVVGCVVGWGASMTAPGELKRTSTGGLQLGQLAGVGAPATAGQLDALCVALRATGPAELADNFPGVRWSKLAINSVTSTIGAIGGDTLGKLLGHRLVRRLSLEVWTEVRAVAEASGVRMTKVGGTIDMNLLTLTRFERSCPLAPTLFLKHVLMTAVGMRFRRMRSSMLYALERGRPPEIDYLNGELVRRGAALGIPTPVNAALVQRVRDIEAGREKSSLDGLLSLARQVG
ncbi:MAG: ketopantoate reductase family protein [Polyangia bacterium]